MNSTVRISILEGRLLRAIGEVLGDTRSGLSNREIKELLAQAGIADPPPEPPPGTYVV
jgi:hypothetical protein